LHRGCEAATNPWGRASHPHRYPPPCFLKIPLPGFRKIANCQGRVQKVRIYWHCSSFKVTMGLPFAHGTQKRWIMAALWRSSPFKFGDNHGQVSSAKLAGPVQWPAWLYSVFQNGSCQGLSPNPCRGQGHPKKRNHNANWSVWIFVHTFLGFPTLHKPFNKWWNAP
jgi:hypothetical protein